MTSTAAPSDFGLQLFENQNLIHRLLNKLRAENGHYAKLLELRFWQEISHQEIADSQLTVYLTEGSSKKYTSVALKRLQELAREEGLFSK